MAGREQEQEGQVAGMWQVDNQPRGLMSRYTTPGAGPPRHVSRVQDSRRKLQANSHNNRPSKKL